MEIIYKSRFTTIRTYTSQRNLEHCGLSRLINGVNLRTGKQGVFPSAYAVDTEYTDFDPSTPKVKRERFLLGYLGSVETLWHKGTNVLCQAVKKIVASNHRPHQYILEISDQGLRMVDKSRRKTTRAPCQDYFYSLKNVSFCAFHPQDHRYMGFITKHPTLQRFACHVFLGSDSTRPVAEAVGSESWALNQTDQSPSLGYGNEVLQNDMET
uniref:PID domain-containing protein n=1 Tax=Rhodnius prolixus TaxID=13249 RepID=T1HSV3_RHOPR